MTIARILAAKGRDVVTTNPDRTLAEVAEVLVAKNIGAVSKLNTTAILFGSFQIIFQWGIIATVTYLCARLATSE